MNLRKLVLIIPPSPWLLSDRDYVLLGPLYISAYLKERGFLVEICDLQGVPEEYWYIPIGDVYGVTGTSPNFVYMKKIIEKLKKRESHKLVIVGGVHATVYSEHVLKYTCADACVIGEGERVMAELMRDFTCINSHPQIVSHRMFDKNQILDLPDINGIPFPDREAIDFYSYLEPKTFGYLNKGNEASIMTSRGCPFDCAFCASKKIHTREVRFRSASNVLKELEILVDRFDVELVNFLDDTFILHKQRIVDICYGIKRQFDDNLKWFFLTRTDCIDQELFRIMNDSGAVSVTYGFETGSQRLLQVLNKNTLLLQSYEAIKVAKKAGLKIRGQLMVGIPTETDEDIEFTATFIKNSSDVDSWGLHIFQPLPGSDIWENPEQYGLHIDRDSDFSTFHTIGKPGKEVADKKTLERFNYLKGIVGNKSCEILAKD